MKHTIIKVLAVVLAIVTAFFLYVFVRSLRLNLALQGLDSDTLEGVNIFIMLEDSEDFGGVPPTYSAWVTDKATVKDCVELLQESTYKYQTMGTPFGRGDIYMEVRFATENYAKDFKLQMYREKDDDRNLGVKTIYKEHEYYINRFSEIDEKKIYDTIYAIAKANPVQLEDTMLP